MRQHGLQVLCQYRAKRMIQVTQLAQVIVQVSLRCTYSYIYKNTSRQYKQQPYKQQPYKQQHQCGGDVCSAT